MCLFPQRVMISTRFGKYSMDVPCQKCIICLKNQQNAWIPRVYYELKDKKKGCFLTLTYNQSSVPKVYHPDTGEELLTLKKSDFQLILKRFRQHYCRANGITKVDWKYFMCGEYGPKTLRPHYHVIFFGLTSDDCSFFISEWQKQFGYCYHENITITHKSLYNVASYISKYACKGLFENEFAKSIKLKTDDLLSPYRTIDPICAKSFRLLSNGLGISYITDNTISYHLASNFICNNSDEQSAEIISRKFHEFEYKSKNGHSSTFKIPLCRYYQKKLFGEANFLTDSNLRSLRNLNEQIRCHELELLPTSLSVDEKIYLIHSRANFKQQETAKAIYEKLYKKYFKSKI